MSKQIKLKDISLHLYLFYDNSTSRVTLRFSPRQSGNRSIYLTDLDKELLRYQRWGKNIHPLLKDARKPEAFALELIEEAYQNLPFLKDVNKVIIHSRGFDLFHLAEIIESLSERESGFKNIRVRTTRAIM